MLPSGRQIARRSRLPLLVGVFVLLVGCDWLGLTGSGLEQPSFHVTDDLTDRIQVVGAESAVVGETREGRVESSAKAPTVRVRVEPPRIRGEVSQATHLSYDSEAGQLYVGYKLGGDPFGGGIDVLNVQTDASTEALVAAEWSLRSDNVDVVEVQSEAGDDRMFAAGAVNTEKLGGAPALITRVQPRDDGVESKSTRLSDFVAKSVVVGPSPGAIHVVTDENALYQLDTDLENQNRLTVDGAGGFRSLTRYGSDLVVLDRSGQVYRASASAFAQLSAVTALTDGPLNERAIARLSSGDGRLFAALNRKGFAIFPPSGERAWTSEEPPGEVLYTSVAEGEERLYAGRLDGTVDVYRLPAGIPAPGKELERIDSFGITVGGGVVGDVIGGQSVNQVLVVDGYLFVANSSGGVVVYELTYGAPAG